jgi:hypothetical protein
MVEQATNHLIVKDRRVSNFGDSEYDELGVRLIREKTLPCQMRKIWGTLALFQLLVGAALLITDIYGEEKL